MSLYYLWDIHSSKIIIEMPNVRETTKAKTKNSEMNYYFAIYKNECLWKNKRWVKGYCVVIR